MTVVESGHWWLIAVVWSEDVGWQVEGIINFGTNVAIFFLTSGSRIWYVVRAYVPPKDAPAVHRV